MCPGQSRPEAREAQAWGARRSLPAALLAALPPERTRGGWAVRGRLISRDCVPVSRGNNTRTGLTCAEGAAADPGVRVCAQLAQQLSRGSVGHAGAPTPGLVQTVLQE